MKASSYATIAIVAIVHSVNGLTSADHPGAVNTTGRLCASGDLNFNNTNVDDLLWCPQHINYVCDRTSGNGSSWFMEYNSTTGPIPENCETILYYIYVQPDVTGSMSLPHLVSVSQAVFGGRYPMSTLSENPTIIPAVPMNLTSLELPDLINVTGALQIEYANQLEAFNVPNLENVDWLEIDLSAKDGYSAPPAINLSFPSLYRVPGGIFMAGNIDAIDLPALNYTPQVNITSTGNLNCTALAASVVNATSSWWRNPDGSNFTVICNSKEGNVSTWHARPTSGGGKIIVKRELMVIVGLVGLLCNILHYS